MTILAELSELLLQKQLSQKCSVNETEKQKLFLKQLIALYTLLYIYINCRSRCQNVKQLLKREGWCVMTKQSNFQLCTQSIWGNQSP